MSVLLRGQIGRIGVFGKQARRPSFGYPFSTTKNSEIRGTIPPWGHGVQVGQYAEVERSFSVQEIEAFGELVQDRNILHIPGEVPWEDLVKKLPHLHAVHDSGLIQLQDDPTQNIKPLVHGIFVSSLFSSIFGTLAPGCVYMNQTLSFIKPVFAEDRIVARIEIQKIRRWKKGGLVLQCETSASVIVIDDDDNVEGNKDGGEEDNSTIAITGIANVWLPSGHQ